MSSITITLKDGSSRQYDTGATPLQIVEQISSSLASKAVAAKQDGKLIDCDLPIEQDCQLEILDRKAPEVIELIRHDLAHVMAQAVLELFPETKPTIGPVINDGFFYDFDTPEPFTEADLAKIEKRMRQIVDEAIPLKREEWTRQDAKQFYEDKKENYKVELLEAIPADEKITMYRQGDFIDLCRGPHMPSTKHAGKAFKLTRVAGSYWRGDSKNKQLQRIYGTAWRSEQELKEYLHNIAEAEKRDHRKVGVVLGLFHLADDAPGSVFWHEKGWTLYRELEEYMRAKQNAAGYQEVKTPQLVDRSLWERSGHWAKFRDNMYLVESHARIKEFAEQEEDTKIFGLKPMNCPCHVQIFRRGVKSYRDLPLRISEFGNCHRCEPTGALHGLMRVRAFTQDDGHIFCTPSQVVNETATFMKLLGEIYSDLGFSDFIVRLADRPPVRSGTDQVWDEAEKALSEACEQANISWEPNPGEGAFYGPKLEFVLRDALKREWQCGTWQVDFVLPESLDAVYVDIDGERKRPVMLHRAILGSFERFIGILIEHSDGNLPLWLAPVQIVVTTITGAADAYAKEVVDKLKNAGIRVKEDLRNEKINYKIREHSAQKIPLIAVVGGQESATRSLALRRFGSNDKQVVQLEEFIPSLVIEVRPPHLS